MLEINLLSFVFTFFIPLNGARTQDLSSKEAMLLSLELSLYL